MPPLRLMMATIPPDQETENDDAQVAVVIEGIDDIGVHRPPDRGHDVAKIHAAGQPGTGPDPHEKTHDDLLEDQRQTNGDQRRNDGPPTAPHPIHCPRVRARTILGKKEGNRQQQTNKQERADKLRRHHTFHRPRIYRTG